MAKQIIILETNPADGGYNTLRCAFWFAIPSNRRVPIPNAQSKWSGATAGDIAAIQDGSVMEEVNELRLPASSTVTEQKAALVKAFTDRGTYLSAQPFKLQNNGVFFDSVSGWSA